MSSGRMISTDFIYFFLVFLVISYVYVFGFFLGTILIFVWFLVYLPVFLVKYRSGNDGAANLRNHHDT